MTLGEFKEITKDCWDEAKIEIAMDSAYIDTENIEITLEKPDLILVGYKPVEIEQ